MNQFIVNNTALNKYRLRCLCVNCAVSKASTAPGLDRIFIIAGFLGEKND